ncbi:hypothetical protein PsorP6_015115 [Peronosclerospora sorghi]|uniref:Uncharacterized protein n=1 Tax=Peronosclerospora sorghi TaxID=230839 RepID=A0ACC0VU43_9STRA|nr:hypothetical protein PsorP6_015115 [Peronosclerospora sorghi]
MASLPTIKDEHQARHYGRDEAPRLYELTRSPPARAIPDATTTYTLRATKPLDASIAEIEAVLTGQTSS